MKLSRDIVLEGIALRIEGDYYKGCRGAREKGSGVQLEPDEPASYEVNAVYVGDADIADLLSAGRLEEIGNTVVEAVASDDEPDEPNPYE